MPSKIKKEFDLNLKKAAKEAEEEQKKFREAEEKLNENYKKVIQEELDAEKYSRLFPEDSTKEYNPVDYYKEGGLVGRGQGRIIKTKKTKVY